MNKKNINFDFLPALRAWPALRQANAVLLADIETRRDYIEWATGYLATNAPGPCCPR